MAIVVMAFVFNWVAVRHEQTTRALYKSPSRWWKAYPSWTRRRSENRLFLRNFLLNGDRREADALARGQSEVERLINEIKENGNGAWETRNRAQQLLDQLADAEREWGRTFAAPLMEKRRQVDTGSATVAELQIAYLTGHTNTGTETKRGTAAGAAWRQ